jgi:hypothetical protein
VRRATDVTSDTERCGAQGREHAGGHLVALSSPKEPADRLEAYREGNAPEEKITHRETGEV